MAQSQAGQETQVVHVQKRSFDVYIGRGSRSHVESPYHNPFIIGPDGSRDEVLLLFFEYWYAPEQAPLRRAAIAELTGKKLGCWCHPDRCHGDIIAGYLAWKAMPTSLEAPQESREPLHDFHLTAEYASA